jgi:hypothetical protein
MTDEESLMNFAREQADKAHPEGCSSDPETSDPLHGSASCCDWHIVFWGTLKMRIPIVELT